MIIEYLKKMIRTHKDEKIFIYGVWDGQLIGVKNTAEIVLKTLSDGLENTLHKFFLQLDLSKNIHMVAILPWRGSLGACIIRSFHNGFDFFHQTNTVYMEWDEVFQQYSQQESDDHALLFHDSKKFLYIYDTQRKTVIEIQPSDILDITQKKKNIWGDSLACQRHLALSEIPTKENC